MGNVNVLPELWAEGAQMECESDVYLDSFSQQGCFHGCELQRDTPAPDQSRLWTQATQALGQGAGQKLQKRIMQKDITGQLQSADTLTALMFYPY